jgi:hypothetical protein
MSRRAPVNEQLGQGRKHIFVAELAGDHQRQALAAGLVDDREDAEPFDKLRRALRPSCVLASTKSYPSACLPTMLRIAGTL